MVLDIHKPRLKYEKMNMVPRPHLNVNETWSDVSQARKSKDHISLIPLKCPRWPLENSHITLA